MTLTMTFQGQRYPKWSKHYQKWILHTKISLKWGIECVYWKKLDFHYCRWRPYLIWRFRHSWHYGGQATHWLVMTSDPLTHFRWETPPTPNCERTYRQATGLKGLHSSQHCMLTNGIFLASAGQHRCNILLLISSSTFFQVWHAVVVVKWYYPLKVW